MSFCFTFFRVFHNLMQALILRKKVMFKLDQFVSTGIVMSFVSAFFSYHVMMKKLMKVKRKKEKQNV